MAFFTKEVKSETYNTTYKKVRVGRIIGCAVAAVIALIIILNCFATVPTGYTGILTTFGRVEDKTMNAGVHVIAPWQKIVKMDNRTQKVDVTTEAFSADIQQVDLILSINYCIDQSTAQNLYKTVGQDYFNIVIYPRILENTKSVIAKYTAENLVANRQTLSSSICELMKADAEKYGIQIVNFSVDNIDFTDSFTNAVENKQVAQQNKLTAETEQAQKTMEQREEANRAVIKAEADAEVAKINAQGEADAIKIRAEAEAEANKKLSESLTEKLLKKIYLENWNGILPQYYMGGSDGVDLLFNVPVSMNETEE